MSGLEARLLGQIASEVRFANRDEARRDQQRRIDQSIAISGISREMSTLGSSIARLVSVSELAMPAIVAELARNSKLLAELLDVTSNPRGNAAPLFDPVSEGL